MSASKTTKREKKRRVAKVDWIAAALEELKQGGVAAVRVEKLAAKLSVSKSGFYWHFRDRQDLLQQLLDYWSETFTGFIAADPKVLAKKPEERLELVVRAVDEKNLAKYDLAFRAWATHDPMAEDCVRRVMNTRTHFIRTAFADLGFKGEDLEMRTRLFVVYHSCEQAVFPDLTPQKRARLRRRRLAFFLRP